MSVKNVTIPSTIDNLPVTKIENKAFEGELNLESVKILDSVTFIGNYAFYNCTSLESIKIPDSCIVCDYAFGGCTSLEKAKESN